MSARTLNNRVALTLVLAALSSAAAHAAPLGVGDPADPAGSRTFIVDDTWWIDVDFLDIPPAVAAAGPGDRIFVRTGAYSGFSLFEGVKILGGSDVKVRGDIHISDLPEGRRAILSNLNVEGLVITNCDSPVIMQDMTIRRPASLFGETAHMRIAESVDVRIRRTTIGGPTGNTPRLSGILVSNSRLELTDSLVTGEHGLPAGLGERNGVPAVRIVDRGAAHISRTTIVGGYGGNGATGGDGAPAVDVEGTGSSLFMTGTVVDLILGGAAGVGQSCGSDGRQGSGIHVGLGATARVSGVEVRQGDDHGCASAPVPDIDVEGTLVEPDPADPTLRMLGSPGAGQVVSFVLTARPGSLAQLDLGRRPVVEVVDGIAESSLLKVLQSIDLGVVPDSGEVRFQLSLASSFLVAPGRLLMAQGSLTDPEGKRLTQSIPLILQ